MDLIFKYLKSIFSSSRNYFLIEQFLEVLQMGKTAEFQLAGCMAIDIKNNLLSKDEYDLLITEFVSTNTVLSLAKFQLFIDTRYTKKNCFSNVCSKNSKTPYVRVLRKAVFEKFYSKSYLYKTSSLKGVKKKYQIAKDQVLKFGWSGYKDIVWVTPYSTFSKFVLSYSDISERANAVCDFVGFPRDSFILKTGSPITGGIEAYLYIKYPEKFNEILYQPNTTNADWSNILILYLSYTKKDGSGRTYNTHGIPFAKERIHERSFFWQDNGFEVHEIGEPSPKTTDKSTIIHEIKKRFSL